MASPGCKPQGWQQEMAPAHPPVHPCLQTQPACDLAYSVYGILNATSAEELMNNKTQFKTSWEAVSAPTYAAFQKWIGVIVDIGRQPFFPPLTHPLASPRLRAFSLGKAISATEAHQYPFDSSRGRPCGRFFCQPLVCLGSA